MFVIYKQTRNTDNETAYDKEWTRQRQHTFGYCTLSPHAPLHLQQSSVHCKFDATAFSLTPAALLASAVYKFVACSGRLW